MTDLRIRFSLDPRYQDFIARATVSTVLGQRVPIASLPDVVGGKFFEWSDGKRRASKRKKDELDLMRILETYPETRDSMLCEIRTQVPSKESEILKERPLCQP